MRCRPPHPHFSLVQFCGFRGIASLIGCNRCWLRESAEEFEQLRQEFHLQFNPIGAPQEAVVRELAVNDNQPLELHKHHHRPI